MSTYRPPRTVLGALECSTRLDYYDDHPSLMGSDIVSQTDAQEAARQGYAVWHDELRICLNALSFAQYAEYLNRLLDAPVVVNPTHGCICQRAYNTGLTGVRRIDRKLQSVIALSGHDWYRRSYDHHHRGVNYHEVTKRRPYCLATQTSGYPGCSHENCERARHRGPQYVSKARFYIESVCGAPAHYPGLDLEGWGQSRDVPVYRGASYEFGERKMTLADYFTAVELRTRGYSVPQVKRLPQTTLATPVPDSNVTTEQRDAWDELQFHLHRRLHAARTIGQPRSKPRPIRERHFSWHGDSEPTPYIVEALVTSPRPISREAFWQDFATAQTGQLEEVWVEYSDNGVDVEERCDYEWRTIEPDPPREDLLQVTVMYDTETPDFTDEVITRLDHEAKVRKEHDDAC